MAFSCSTEYDCAIQNSIRNIRVDQAPRGGFPITGYLFRKKDSPAPGGVLYWSSGQVQPSAGRGFPRMGKGGVLRILFPVQGVFYGMSWKGTTKADATAVDKV